MRKDAKIALCVILALMVLVVIIWGRSQRADDQLPYDSPTPSKQVASNPDAQPAPQPLAQRPAPPPPQPSQDRTSRDVLAAAQQAPDRAPEGFSALFPGDRPAMINHLAVLTHDGPPPETERHALQEPGPAPPRDRTGLAPAPPARPLPPLKPEPAVKHKVQKGDTYQGLARKYYKDASKWQLIYKANNVAADRLLIGQELTIPPLPPETPPASAAVAKAPGPVPAPAAAKVAAAAKALAAANTYEVKKGDTFYTIARQLYHDPAKWQKLYEANRAKLPDPAKPDSLRAGTVIEVPLLADAR